MYGGLDLDSDFPDNDNDTDNINNNSKINFFNESPHQFQNQQQNQHQQQNQQHQRLQHQHQNHQQQQQQAPGIGVGRRESRENITTTTNAVTVVKEKESLPSTSSAAFLKSAAKEIPRMLKVAVVGDATAGKSCLCKAFSSEENFVFSDNYNPTLGVGIHCKSVKMPSSSVNVTRDGYGDGDDQSEPVDRVNLILVDSSGSDLYENILSKYWEKLDGVDAILLIFDLTSTESFVNAEKWLDLVKNYSLSVEGNVIGVLFGNKVDLDDGREVSPVKAQEFAKTHNFMYFEGSAKERRGLEEPFFYLIHSWNTLTAGTGRSSSNNSGSWKKERERERGNKH